MSMRKGGGDGGGVPIRGASRGASRMLGRNVAPRMGGEGALFSIEGKQDLSAAILLKARQTGQINLSGKGLAQVPDKVWRVNDLGPDEQKELDVRLDQTSGSAKWWEHQELTKLMLSSNKISNIPKDVANLTALTTLDLRDNQLQSLPDEIGELKRLHTLNVSHNQITHLPKTFYKLEELVNFNAEHNKIQILDDDLGYLHNLQQVNMSSNSLPYLPASVGFLTRVQTLNLSNNQLSSLAPEIGCMMGLQQLDLSHNSLGSVPNDLGELPHLKQLNVRHNQLKDFPTLQSCREIHTILLGSNQIRELKEEDLQWVTSVRVLDLRDNKLSIVPDQILKLQRLERLDLTNNSLTGLPGTLSLLPHLKSLGIEGNSIRNIRRDLVSRGTTHLLRHLREQMSPEEAEKASQSILGGGENILGLGAPMGAPMGAPRGGPGASGQCVDKFEMHKTRTLTWAGKGVSHFGADLANAAKEAQVTIVDLSKNAFALFPQQLEVLYSTVTELNLSFNQLQSVPSELSSCVRLQFLDISHNRLEGMDIGALAKLREINISFNRMRHVPECLYDCGSLEILFASDNQVEDIDVAGLSRLTRLATLDLRNNSIAAVPPELGNLTQLRWLQLEGNSFRAPRASVLSQGTSGLLSYLRDRIPA